MFAEAQYLNLPEPRIDEIGMRYRFTVFLANAISVRITGQINSNSGAQSQQVLYILQKTPFSMKELISVLRLKNKTGALKRTINELLSEDYIEYTIPDKHNSRMQKYRLTGKGKRMLKKD
jgi:ATP-dependent DNA helicase RecG